MEAVSAASALAAITETAVPAESKRERGMCKWFDATRGYGFLQRNGGGADVFVHFSAIQTKEKYKSLVENQPVEFEVDETCPKGPIARNVVPQKSYF